MDQHNASLGIEGTTEVGQSSKLENDAADILAHGRTVVIGGNGEQTSTDGAEPQPTSQSEEDLQTKFEFSIQHSELSEAFFRAITVDGMAVGQLIEPENRQGSFKQSRMDLDVIYDLINTRDPNLSDIEEAIDSSISFFPAEAIRVERCLSSSNPSVYERI
jgi:hypothetical protein